MLDKFELQKMLVEWCESSGIEDAKDLEYDMDFGTHTATVRFSLN